MIYSNAHERFKIKRWKVMLYNTFQDDCLYNFSVPNSLIHKELKIREKFSLCIFKLIVHGYNLYQRFRNPHLSKYFFQNVYVFIVTIVQN